jgi:hypothetical protein
MAYWNSIFLLSRNFQRKKNQKENKKKVKLQKPMQDNGLICLLITDALQNMHVFI